MEGGTDVMEKDNWYCLIGIGTDGVEALCSTTDIGKFREAVDRLQLRARINSQRNIRVLGWRQTQKSKMKDFENTEYLELIKKRAVELKY